MATSQRIWKHLEHCEKEEFAHQGTIRRNASTCIYISATSPCVTGTYGVPPLQTPVE